MGKIFKEKNLGASKSLLGKTRKRSTKIEHKLSHINSKKFSPVISIMGKIFKEKNLGASKNLPG
jgi:hypothetical protein